MNSFIKNSYRFFPSRCFGESLVTFLKAMIEFHYGFWMVERNQKSKLLLLLTQAIKKILGIETDRITNQILNLQYVRKYVILN